MTSYIHIFLEPINIGLVFKLQKFFYDCTNCCAVSWMMLTLTNATAQSNCITTQNNDWFTQIIRGQLKTAIKYIVIHNICRLEISTRCTRTGLVDFWLQLKLNLTRRRIGFKWKMLDNWHEEDRRNVKLKS